MLDIYEYIVYNVYIGNKQQIHGGFKMKMTLELEGRDILTLYTAIIFRINDIKKLEEIMELTALTQEREILEKIKSEFYKVQ